jgi:hypothetical protein
LGKKSRTIVAIVAEIALKVTDICLINETVVVEATDNNFFGNLVNVDVDELITDKITPLINLRATVAVLVDR